jgi:hypothetical protein
MNGFVPKHDDVSMPQLGDNRHAVDLMDQQPVISKCKVVDICFAPQTEIGLNKAHLCATPRVCVETETSDSSGDSGHSVSLSGRIGAQVSLEEKLLQQFIRRRSLPFTPVP